jgi:hypothetical protein
LDLKVILNTKQSPCVACLPGLGWIIASGHLIAIGDNAASRNDLVMAQSGLSEAIYCLSAFGGKADIGRRIAPIVSSAYDPERTYAAFKSRSAAVSYRTALCYRLGRKQGGGWQPSASIQNDSGLAQGLAGCSAAG